MPKMKQPELGSAERQKQSRAETKAFRERSKRFQGELGAELKGLERQVKRLKRRMTVHNGRIRSLKPDTKNELVIIKALSFLLS